MKSTRKVKSSMSWALRRDLRQVDRALSRLEQKPAKPDALDTERVRAELERQIGPISSVGEGETTYADLYEIVDSYAVEFLETLRAKHAARLNQLDGMEQRIRPYLVQAQTLVSDEYRRLLYLDAAVMNALDRVSDPETPIFDPRTPEPKRSVPGDDVR
jgi:hypothetical protein